MTKHTDTEGQAGASRPGPSSSGHSSSGGRKRRGNTPVWVALAIVAGLFAGFFLGRQFPAPPPPPAQNATLEEPRESELARKAKLAEQAVHKSLKALAPDAAAKVEASEPREHAGQTYSFETLRLPKTDRQALHERLVKELTLALPSAKLTRAAPDAWDIAVDGLPLLRLNLPAEVKAEEPAKPGKGRLAIVIDDMGEDVALARQLSQLGVPIAFSIWPDSGHREEVLKIGKAAGREILIHLPMQPMGYPKVAPGPNALLVSMTAEEIQAAVHRAVKRVHGAIGLNNHMGSEFTKSPYGMRAALSAMREDGLFFLDSRTSAASVAAAESKKLGLRTHQRDVFLDNEQNVAAIVKQLKKAEATARERGHAIAIGHPHKETVAALRQWLKEKDAAVQVVTVTSLPPL